MDWLGFNSLLKKDCTFELKSLEPDAELNSDRVLQVNEMGLGLVKVSRSTIYYYIQGLKL